MSSMYQTVTAGYEVRTKVAVSRTEDDLVMLGTLYAVFHHVTVDCNVFICVTDISMAQPNNNTQANSAYNPLWDRRSLGYVGHAVCSVPPCNSRL